MARPAWKPILAFSLFSVLIASARLHTWDEPLERDITTYAVIGHEMLGGRPLYSDLWDHKPPAIHVTFALGETIAGYGPKAIYFLGLAGAVLSLAGVMAASASAGPTAPLWAGAFWTVISADMLLQANQPNCETFINAFLILGFALLVTLPRVGRSSRRTLAMGSCFALAALYKPIAIVPAVLLVAIHVAYGGRAGRAHRLRDASAVLASVAVAWLAVLAYFAWVGRFGSFWDAVVLYNRAYQTSGWETDGGRHPLLPSAVAFTWPLLALIAAGAALGARQDRARSWLLLGAYLLGTLVSIVLPGHRHPHYHQLWLPALSVGAAWGVAEVTRSYARLGWILGAAALAACLAHEIPTFALSADQWSAAKYGKIFVTARDLAPRIDAMLLPQETFYEFGAETGLYYLTRRRPPSGVLYVYPLFDGPLVQSLSERLVEDLKREPPELFILSGDYVTQSEDGETFVPKHPRLAEILERYAPRWIVKGRPTYFLFTLAGGALEARAEESPRAPQFSGLEPL